MTALLYAGCISAQLDVNQFVHIAGGDTNHTSTLLYLTASSDAVKLSLSKCASLQCQVGMDAVTYYGYI